MKIFKKDKQINWSDVQPDVEYMYKDDDNNDKFWFVTISKKNGEYVGYIQAEGLTYLLGITDEPVYELTDEAKQEIVDECVHQYKMFTFAKKSTRMK